MNITIKCTYIGYNSTSITPTISPVQLIHLQVHLFITIYTIQPQKQHLSRWQSLHPTETPSKTPTNKTASPTKFYHYHHLNIQLYLFQKSHLKHHYQSIFSISFKYCEIIQPKLVWYLTASSNDNIPNTMP